MTKTVTIPEALDLNNIGQKNGSHGSQNTIQNTLNELLEGFSPVDWVEAGLGESPKQKHIIVEVVCRVLEAADARQWGLARRYDFIYIFTGAHWQQVERDALKAFLAKAAVRLGYSPLESRYYEFQDKLLKQFLAEAYLPEPEPDKSKTLVNLQNGTLEITERGAKLREHRPGDFLTYVLPFAHNEHADAPLFQAYLNQVLPEPSTQAVVAEFIASCFVPSLKLEKVLLLYGSGANGKSVFADIVGALLGPSNVSNYSLSNLAEEHNRAQIANKLLNFGSEINAGGIARDMFKLLASGEPVQARLKYGNPFVMTNYAKLAFNANTLPSDTEQSEAYFRRFVIIPFKVQIPEAQQDKGLAKRIIANELPGVFAWVIAGLERLLQRGNLSACAEAEALLLQYRRESDTVVQFIEEGDDGRYVPSLCEYVKQEELYLRYRTFCSEGGFRPVSVRKFKERLEKIGFQTDKRNFGKIVYCTFEAWT